jgi:tetraacyldisaccharide 4'-kinase
VPVIVVGNITVGGTGKTPLVLWLAGLLRRHGMKPGIVSRGYGGRIREPRKVCGDADPADFGDEPVLIARRSGCPVWVGADRAAAAAALLAAAPDCDVVISDDGLQHYALQRDVELALIDGARGLGNRLLLPAGPLREPPSRLDVVDAIVVNGPGAVPRTSAPVYTMTLNGAEFRNVVDPARIAAASHFAGKRVLAVAAIGNPARFFDHLGALRVEFETRSFPDHHAYTPADFADVDADAVVMTEKDAVKCTAFARDTWWVLPVEAEPEAGLGELVLGKLGQKRERVNQNR